MGLRPMATAAAILFFSSAAHAGIAEELTAAINKCAAIADDGVRHACYDQLPTLVKSLASVAAAEAPPPGGEKDHSAGAFGGLSDGDVPAEHITAKVESFTFDYGAFVVTLDNGQVWRQVAARGEFIPLSKSKKDQITIWRNSFGDDVLKIEGYHTAYHVRRIR